MLPMQPSFSLRIADAELDPDPLDPAAILAGDPQASDAVIWESEDGRIVRGIWQCTPGVVADVEQDEMFVVVSGRASIAFEDGRMLDVGPGDMGVLSRGARTTWTVHETIRKAYQITLTG
jgi:uncharacterized protein